MDEWRALDTLVWTADIGLCRHAGFDVTACVGTCVFGFAKITWWTTPSIVPWERSDRSVTGIDAEGRTNE